MADEKNPKNQMDELDESVLEFANQAAGHLKNTTHTLSELLDAMSSKVRADVADLRKELFSNPLVDKNLTSLIKRNREEALAYIKTLVDQGKLTQKAADQFVNGLEDMTDELRRSYDIFDKGTKAVRANIQAKKDELDAYEEGVKETKAYITTQEKLNDITRKVKDNEKILAEKRDTYQKYVQKEIPDQEKKIQQLKEQIKQKEALGELVDEEIQDLKAKEDLLQTLIEKRNEEILAIREIQEANEKRLQSAKDHEEDLADIELDFYREKKEAAIDADKQSSKFSTNMKAHMHEALMGGESVIGGMKKGFESLSGIQKRRGLTDLGASLRSFSKDRSKFMEEATKKKALETGDPSAKLGGLEKFSTSMKGLFNSLPKLLSGAMKGIMTLIKALMNSVIVKLIMKLVGMVSSFMKALDPVFKIMNIFEPLIGFFENIFGTWGEMLEGIMSDMYSFRREMTMTAGVAAKTATSLQFAGRYAELGKDASKLIRENFEAVVEYTNSYVMNIEGSVNLMAKLQRLTGISAKDSAVFVTQMQMGLEKSNEEIEKMVVSVKTDAQGAGLNFKTVMTDVANYGSKMAMYGEKIATGIMKATVRARELGGSLKSYDSLMDSFGEGWEGVITLATNFNRIAGDQVIDAHKLKVLQLKGDIGGLQEYMVDALKKVKKEDRRGFMGERLASIFKLDKDEYMKLVENLDIEEAVTPALKNIDNIISKHGGLFGSLGDPEQQKGLDQALKSWEEGMTKANRDVSKERETMMRQAMTTAAKRAVESGAAKTFDDFAQKVNSGDKNAVELFQKAMRDRINFQDFKDMKQTLEDSMSPQERMEMWIKDLAKKWLPKIIELLSYILDGVSFLVEHFVGAKAWTVMMKQMSAQFKTIAFTGKAGELQKEVVESLKEGELSLLMEKYGKGLEGMKQDTSVSGIQKLLEELKKRSEKDTEAQNSISKLMLKLEESKEYEAKSARYMHYASTNAEKQAEAERAGGNAGIVENSKKHVKKGAEIGADVVTYGLYGKVAKLFGGSDEKNDGKEKKSGRKSSGRDIAFSKGVVKYVVDDKNNVVELHPEDSVVASTNFNFGRDSVPTGMPLAQGSIKFDNSMTTSGKGGSGTFIPHKDVPEDKRELLQTPSSKGFISEVDPENGTPATPVMGIGKGKYTKSGLKIAEIAVQYARQNIKESGGDNKGPEVENFVKKIGAKPHIPWCGAFAGSVLKDANSSLYKPTTLAVQYRDQAKAKKTWSTEPMPGALGVYSYGVKPGRTHESGHVDIVIGVKDDKNYYAVGGNEGKEGAVKSSLKSSVAPRSLKKGGQFQGFALPINPGESILDGSSGFSLKDAKFSETSFESSRDLAMDHGSTKFIVDKYGNWYELKSGEGVVATTNDIIDGTLKGKSGHFMKSSEIFQNLSIPKSWKDKISDLGGNISGQFINQNMFGELKTSLGEKMPDFAKFVLEKIGYTQEEIEKVKNRVVERMYNELFYGYDSTILDSWRIKDIDWRSLTSENSATESTMSSSKGEQKVLDLISGHEGGYGTLTPNDAGLPSYGKFQWRGGAFKNILLEYLKKGSLAKELSAYQSQIESWDNPVALASDKGFQELMKTVSEDPIMKEIQNKTMIEGRHFTAAKKAFSDLGLKTAASLYVLADTSVNGGMGVVLNKYGAKGFPKTDEASWANNFLDKRLDRYKNLDNWGKYGKGWTRRIDTIRNQVPELVQENIADAYFGKGDALGIMTKDGYFSMRKNDAVAVGTKLPDAKTNTKLSEGQLGPYLSNKNGGTKSYSNEGSEFPNREMISAIQSLIRSIREMGKDRNIVLNMDSEKVARITEGARVGHGSNLNGG